jgi:aspartyl protease family protein
MSRDTLFWVLMGVLGVAIVLLMLNNDAGQTFGVENYQFASLALLGSLGLFFAINLFGRGAPIGPLLRIVAMWLCLFLALMVAYQALARFDLLPENFRQRTAPENSESV